MQSLVFVTMAVSFPSLKPPSCEKLGDNSIYCPPASTAQVGFFYFALYLMALGAGGIKSNVSAFAGDQFDKTDAVESRRKISFLNWWLVSISFGTMLSVSLFVYVEENVGWSWGYGAATFVTSIASLLFFAGTPSYRHLTPAGSPLTRVAQVIVAAIRKWHMTLPAGHLDIGFNLYEPEGVSFSHKSRLPHTDEFA